MSEDLKCKIVIFGESQVGKTSIIKRYLGYGFDEEVISTYGIENEKKTLEIGDKTVTIIFWDTAGQERFRSIIKAAYKNLDIAIFAFDLTNMETLNAIKDFWFDEVETNSSNSSKVIGLFGNKSDLVKDGEEIEVEKAARAFAKKIDAVYKRTSALDGNGVIESINQLVEKFAKGDQRKVNKANQSSGVTLKSNKETEKKKGCC